MTKISIFALAAQQAERQKAQAAASSEAVDKALAAQQSAAPLATPTPTAPTAPNHSLASLLSRLPETEVVDDIDLTASTALTPAEPTEPAKPAIQLNTTQTRAVNTFVNNSHGALIGYAGTGKTTTVKQAIERITDNEEPQEHNCEHLAEVGLPNSALSFVMCAFTGMAVKALKRSVGMGSEFAQHCFTIHKLLDYGPVEEEGPPSAAMIRDGANPNIPVLRKVMRPRRDRANPLPFKIVVIDEVSMLSTELFGELLDALSSDARIYVIGDIAQLPPVFGTSIMPYLGQAWPSIELTEIYRQKEGSMIDNANRIRAGQNPVTSDLFRMAAIDKQEIVAQKQVVDAIAEDFRSGRYDPTQDTILCTNNVSPVGQEMLNTILRTHLNTHPSPVINVGTMRGVKRFKVGDRVMCTKNNASLGIYNGMLGWITAISINPAQAGEARKLNPALNSSLESSDPGASGDNLLSVLDDMREEQNAAREKAKMAALFGQPAGSVTVVADEEEGTASRQSTHVITVRFDDAASEDEVVILATSSQLENLIPAWAITVHKSQGSGFRNVYIVLHNAGGQLLTNELLYTAVTRCTESVSIFTTRYAWQKALTTQRIKGRTLDEKLQSYLEQYGTRGTGKTDSTGRTITQRIPRNRSLAFG